MSVALNKYICLSLLTALRPEWPRMKSLSESSGHRALIRRQVWVLDVRHSLHQQTAIAKHLAPGRRMFHYHSSIFFISVTMEPEDMSIDDPLYFDLQAHTTIFILRLKSLLWHFNGVQRLKMAAQCLILHQYWCWYPVWPNYVFKDASFCRTWIMTIHYDWDYSPLSTPPPS